MSQFVRFFYSTFRLLLVKRKLFSLYRSVNKMKNAIKSVVILKLNVDDI